jgi:hypothetical protein
VETQVSRSKKGQKGIGYEVDRKAEGEHGYRCPGRLAKDIAHSHQRRESLVAAKKNLEERGVDTTPCERCGCTEALHFTHTLHEFIPHKKKTSK